MSSSLTVFSPLLQCFSQRWENGWDTATAHGLLTVNINDTGHCVLREHTHIGYIFHGCRCCALSLKSRHTNVITSRTMAALCFRAKPVRPSACQAQLPHMSSNCREAWKEGRVGDCFGGGQEMNTKQRKRQARCQTSGRNKLWLCRDQRRDGVKGTAGGGGVHPRCPRRGAFTYPAFTGSARVLFPLLSVLSLPPVAVSALSLAQTRLQSIDLRRDKPLKL